jgi:pyruvate-formate lyase-activating enzyme
MRKIINYKNYLYHAFRASTYKTVVVSKLNNYTIFKKINYFWKLYLDKRPQYPKNVQIEITNACNYECIMCYRHSMENKIGFMDFTTFTKIIDDCVESGVKSVKPQFRGESLIHPKVSEMIKYAKDKGLHVHITTNAELLSEKIAEKIIKSGLDHIIISFHGFDREQYEKIHGKDSFEKTLDNIKKFAMTREKLGSKTPKISLQATIMDLNYKSISNIFEMFKGYTDEFRVSNCGYHPETMIYDGRLYKHNTRRTIPCLSPLTNLSISWDGKVTLCCVDSNFSLDIGTIDEGIVNLFNSEKLNYLRKLHLQGKFEKISICSYCTDDNSRKKFFPEDVRNKILKGEEVKIG